MKRLAWIRISVAALIMVVFLAGGMGVQHRTALAQVTDDTPIPAANAFNAGCNSNSLSQEVSRSDPEWTPIIHDLNNPIPNDPPTILEGTVETPDQKFGAGNETSNSQAPSEVSEEDLPWSH